MFSDSSDLVEANLYTPYQFHECCSDVMADCWRLLQMLTDSLCKLQARWRLPERLVIQQGVKDVVPESGGPMPLEIALEPILYSACTQNTHQQG